MFVEFPASRWLELHVSTSGDDNTLAQGRWGSNSTNVFFQLNLEIYILVTFCEIYLKWVQENSMDNKTLDQLMAWYRQENTKMYSLLLGKYVMYIIVFCMCCMNTR